MNALANAGVFFDSTFPENIHIVVKKENGKRMYYQKIYLPFDGMYPEKESGMFYFPRNHEEHERDKKRIYNMYPEAAKRLAPYVEEMCDRLEYEGGILYDEYPDQLRMRMKCSEICKQVQGENDAEDVMMDICQILLYHEMYLRRCKRREHRKRRFF